MSFNTIVTDSFVVNILADTSRYMHQNLSNEWIRKLFFYHIFFQFSTKKEMRSKLIFYCISVPVKSHYRFTSFLNLQSKEYNKIFMTQLSCDYALSRWLLIYRFGPDNPYKWGVGPCKHKHPSSTHYWDFFSMLLYVYDVIQAKVSINQAKLSPT